MAQVLWIPGPLPGLNDLLAAKGSGHGRANAYARLKARWTDHIALLARAARLRPVAAAEITFAWCERNRRRDPDNIAAGGRKLVLDALVAAGVLPNDGWGQVREWTDTFELTRTPGVRVTLVEPNGV